MEKLVDELIEFDYFKKLILDGKTHDRNVLIQKKDGTCAVIHPKIKWDNIPGTDSGIDEVERVTIFVEGKEYEFVACQ